MEKIIVSTLVNDTFIHDLILKFIDELPIIVSDIEKGLQIQELTEVENKIHDLKGLGGGVGYPQLTKISGEIETLVRQNRINEAIAVAERLKKMANDICASNKRAS